MSNPFQIVPWFNIEEWHEVYNELFGSNSTLASKQKGLEHLLIWKARCPNLPSGIESTLTLLEVHIQDITSHVQTNSDSLMRLAYSSALMRFVNHMLDSETSKGLNLFRAAKNIGIPDWIIELRHDTAHSERLPSIEQLREASLISLEWLQNYYWDKHKECIANYVLEKTQDSQLENKIEGIINFYLSLSICSHSHCKIKKVSDIEDTVMRDSLVNDAKDILGDSMNFSNLESITIHSLIEAMKVKAKKLFNNNNSSEYVNKVLISEQSLFLSLEVHRLLDHYNFEYTKPFSKQYIKCFAKLLEFLHINELLQDFVLGLIKFTQTEENCNMKRLAARWVSTILQAWQKNQQFTEQLKKTDTKEDILKDEKKLKSLFYHWYPNEKENVHFLDLNRGIPSDLTSMTFIQPIISTYNPNLIYFIKDLLHLIRPCLPSEVIDKIYNLAKVVAYPEKFPITSSKIYTVDDLKSADSKPNSVPNGSNKSIAKKCNEENNDNNITMDHNQVTFNDKEDKKMFGVWQMASTNYDWASCAIGILPWQMHAEPMET